MLKTLPKGCADMCVTSPPYYGLRDYGVNGQIGLEQSPDSYIQKLMEVFQEVWRVLRDNGTLWIIIADSYAGSGKGAGAKKKSKQSYKYSKDNKAVKMPKLWNGIKQKDMIGIPWQLAFALRQKGWFLRSDIVWQKPNAMPESVKDRPARSYEHIFLLSKSPRYYFNHEAIKQPVKASTVARYRRAVGENKYSDGIPGQTMQGLFRTRRDSLKMPLMRNCRDVWTIPTKPYKGAHFATYPVDLIIPCILAGCPKGGIVLDPFLGVGTTGIAAIRTERQYIGIELNPNFCNLARDRIEKETERS
ncbi:hypothetical protein A5N82_09665 [Christensenella minuta]|uniref:Methyltransferase n=1 Tax=Christensenella minuta TaxID=626937 RepID=A0A136Q7K3_9FIRM|nr:MULTISPECIES: site-specific DNA-methyltransferase [Christensenella]AYH41714.1 site-specific DNA-methyltransferase [Christensenella minuta]KXK66661.1 DNA (cytosine-5-)-methyltransferase [Christensenella minuta]OAQ36930.1 hypothetical protein A5N82_09665 [Christensenella minuta]